MRNKLGFLGFGLIFGFTLSRVGASEFDLIFGMFIGEDFKLAWVIITAIIIGHIGMRYLTGKSGKSLTKSGEKIKISHKKLGQWSLIGALLFGVGWAITGACPGTVLAQVGEGKVFAVFTMAGMVVGTYIYAILKEKHPKI